MLVIPAIVILGIYMEFLERDCSSLWWKKECRLQCLCCTRAEK